MTEKKLLCVRLGTGEIRECVIVLCGGPPWQLSFSGIELPVTEFTGDDLFKALCKLREELEKLDAKALCAGARPDVFPSGMSRSMGGGRKAYITRLGSPAVRTDLIDIFDYAGPESVGSVAQQTVFHEKWADHFRQ